MTAGTFSASTVTGSGRSQRWSGNGDRRSPRPSWRPDGCYAGDLLAAERPRPAVLFTSELGDASFLDISAEQSYRYGEVVAQIHDALEDTDGPFR